MMMKICLWVAAGVAMSMAAGCAVMPYQPAANEPMASVKYFGWGSPRICKGGKMYSLSSVGNSDVYQVPVGQPIAFGANLQSGGYNVTYFCNPWLGFTPEANRTYVANAGLAAAGRCFIELVREDNSRETGVAVEPTLARAPSCTAPPPAASAAASAPR
ncbi:hypothetical protein [Piscinibacter gummiphilus]|uniref:Uncharacterized protein n=1 Tax=Piscinibacter gummiphilus TaxID=946333 RepID=A0ABZ0D180_9BURK|nr:hypothetical protein [Piscinibacter gummiphilus]WOB10506.1 hypothetical protein RXV79_10685 [Piscinibacter gummiphilus]